MSFLFIALVVSILSVGCSHNQAKVNVPPPPTITETETAESEPIPEPSTQPNEREDHEENAIHVPPNSKPLMVETGMASWYGAPYHNRRGSNGEVYNMNAMTAAHRTLPLGSIVRVTNEKTGTSALVRITDRGPFVDGRILDLSLAAAKQCDVWRAGVAKVRLEVLSTPSPLQTGGRWAVQIGAFDKEHDADQLAGHLSRRYHTAKVLCFSSPVGDWWVRVRVQDDDRKRAEEVAKDTKSNEASIFLVRLD
jgi:rare lipoprotein A